MARIRTLAALLVLAGLFPAAAGAGPLVSATWTQEVWGFALTVTNSGATCSDANPAHIPSYTVFGCPTAGLQASGGSAGTSYNVALTLPLFQAQGITTGGVRVYATMATLSGTQAISGSATSATATQAIHGQVLWGAANHNMASMWSQPLMATIIAIPLDIGRPGQFLGSFTEIGSDHYLTVDFYGWTAGTLTFTGLSSFSMALPNVVAMGSFGLTPGGAGTVTLVAPSKISADGPYAQRRTVNLTALKLSFVPEPAALLLLGASALVLLGSARRS
jgi:hypothetical protein